MKFYEMGEEAVSEGCDIEDIVKLSVREKIGRFKYIEEENVRDEYENIINALNEELETLKKGE